MRRLLVALAVVAAMGLAGCRAGTAPGEKVGGGVSVTGSEQINYIHDDKHGVGCWFYVGSDSTSISCLADKDYRP